MPSNYFPQPTRAWSRVDGLCGITTMPNNEHLVYNTFSQKYLPLAAADLQTKIIHKGNILQYRNTGNLTKKQKYSMIAKNGTINKRKTYATQSVTYSNPNTSSLYRINAISVPPNSITGSVNNVSGPFQTGIPDPFNCPTQDIQNGGTLICNTLANVCTNEIIKTYPVRNCFPITCSDVPGFGNPKVQQFLCWSNKLNTWLTRVRRIMSNSSNKWPQNYKAFVSACLPTEAIEAPDDDDDNGINEIDTNNVIVNRPIVVYSDLVNSPQFIQIMSIFDQILSGDLDSLDQDTIDNINSQLDDLLNLTSNSAVITS